MKTYKELLALFHRANDKMLIADAELIKSQVSERTLCGVLMLHMHDEIAHDKSFPKYFVDVEYNRNKGSIKTIYKGVMRPNAVPIRINCDLILHSRGGVLHQDNLIAIEMKKSTRSKFEEDSDRQRLIALTKDSFNNTWFFDGTAIPEFVCRYVLGIYYEINYRANKIHLEYYQRGCLTGQTYIDIEKRETERE